VVNVPVQSLSPNLLDSLIQIFIQPLLNPPMKTRANLSAAH
jgi:hypothetical protein